MGGEWSREQFARERIARLATANTEGLPHLVPIVFVVQANTIYTAVDAKPKSGALLRRLANIAANPQASVLVDGYRDDWTELWWARADGSAHILDGSDMTDALDLLADKYPQYVTARPPGPVVAVSVLRWSGWRAAE